MTQNCDTDGDSRDDLERLVDEIHSQHQSSLRRQKDGGERKFLYRGMRSKGSRRMIKYEGARYARVNGGHARLLTDDEIAEFRAAIQRVIDPTLREPPIMRRAIV